jgi:undecaprenyl-phosphate 4-deoxy-4-formamido-L-arabinose transferase
MAPDAPIDARPTVSVVIPAYRSPGTLDELCEELHRVLTPLTSGIEVIIVDDGSPDETWSAIVGLATRHEWVRGLRLLRNYGQHNALLAGITAATGELIVTVDDDLQNPPDQIPILFEALGADVDLVYGYPQAEQHSTGRNVASRLTKWLMSVGLGKDVNSRASAFRLFRSHLVTPMREIRDPFVSIDVLLTWSTAKVRAVPVRFDPRRAGTSGYGFRRLARHTLNMVTGYSTAPLRFVSAIGTMSALIGFGLLVLVLARWAIGSSSVPGFTFLAGAITLFSGVQLLSLGVLGEYLGRMHFRSMGRPGFVVRDEVDQHSISDHAEQPPADRDTSAGAGICGPPQ